MEQNTKGDIGTAGKDICDLQLSGTCKLLTISQNYYVKLHSSCINVSVPSMFLLFDWHFFIHLTGKKKKKINIKNTKTGISKES